MNGVVASEFRKVKRARDTLQEQCDELQAMVGSLQLQLSLYAGIMKERHLEEKNRKKGRISQREVRSLVREEGWFQ
jgi:hypothetical protein